MSQNLNEPSRPDPQGPDQQPEVLDVTPASLAPQNITPAGGGGGGRGRRGVLVGAGVLVVALVGGGVALGASRLGGGGAQPDEAVPASALGFVSVDLDPGAGQKVDALRFARKFPDAASKIGKDDDLRKAMFDAARSGGGLSGDWATDVEPWLGQRAGLAVLPPKAEGEDPQTVVVLSVTDPAMARASIPKITEGKASCEVTDEWAVCAPEAGVAKQAVADAAKSPLSDNKNYGSDVDSLGDDGIARAWFDLGKIGEAIPDAAGSVLGAPALMGGGAAGFKGRAVQVLRFDGPTLELAGNVIGADVPEISGHTSVGDLPADSVAAFGLAGADKVVDQVWKQVKAAAEASNGAADLDAQVAELKAQYGITVPDDVRAAVGDQFSIAFGGMQDGSPQVAARLGGDAGAVEKLLTAARSAAGPTLTLGTAKAGEDSVLASSQPYADAVAKGSGLGSSEAFKNAVPDADAAQSVLFVDISKLVEQFADTLPAESRKNIDPLAAFGASASRDGDKVSYSVRLTTR